MSRQRLRSLSVKVWIPHEIGLSLIGEPPADTTIEVFTGDETGLPSDPATVEFWCPPFLSSGSMVALLDRMPGLRMAQVLCAGAAAWWGRLRACVPLCDPRGLHDSSTSEWVVPAILAHLRNFPAFVRAQ